MKAPQFWRRFFYAFTFKGAIPRVCIIYNPGLRYRVSILLHFLAGI